MQIRAAPGKRICDLQDWWIRSTLSNPIQEKYFPDQIKYFNAYKGQIYPKSLYNIPLNYYNKENILVGNLENNEGDLLSKTNNNTATNGVAKMLIKHMLWKRLLTSKFLSALKKEWFNSYEFFAGTTISNKKYRHLRSKHNKQQNYTLAYYFAESKTIKGNVNKFLTDLLMTLLHKKLSYKNVDK